MYKKEGMFLIAALCSISLCGCIKVNIEFVGTNDEDNVETDALGTKNNPVNPYDGYTLDTYLSDSSGTVTIQLDEMWVGQDAVDEMKTQGLDSDYLDSTYEDFQNKGKEMALLEYTITVEEGFEDDDFLPALFLLSYPYEDDFKTPVNGGQVEWTDLDGQIKNGQLMGEGDSITGYISYVYEEGTSVIYDNVCADGSMWVEYDME